MDDDAVRGPSLAVYLEAQERRAGCLPRDRDPDLLLRVTFAPGDRGPEFIRAEPEGDGGVRYRMDATLVLLDPSGRTITRPVGIHADQGDSPEGLVDQFRRQVGRRLPGLIADALAGPQ